MEKCDICGKEQKDDWTCNAAVIGTYLEIKGHQQCVEAVNQLVVIPNRMKVMPYIA
tara:strand:- start:927 stop:1094 length:168 start_codon:yes stop_codon:yes gene_type:complete